jgi:hypothetical protein
MSHRVLLVGAGAMGVGIATLTVGRGIPVVLVDTDPERLAEAPKRVRAQLRGARLFGKLPTDSRVYCPFSAWTALRSALAVCTSRGSIAPSRR